MDLTRWFPVLVILCLFGCCGEAAAARNWQSLQGVDGFEIVIGHLNPVAVEDGLSQGLLYADVARSLGAAGIKVLTKEQRSRTPGAPWIYVSVGTVKTNLGAYVYSVSVALFQEAVLKSNGINTSVQTWERGSFGMTRSQDLARIREAVGELLLVFIKDYLAMNR